MNYKEIRHGTLWKLVECKSSFNLVRSGEMLHRASSRCVAKVNSANPRTRQGKRQHRFILKVTSIFKAGRSVWITAMWPKRAMVRPIQT